MANVIEMGNEVIITINDPYTGEPCAIHRCKQFVIDWACQRIYYNCNDGNCIEVAFSSNKRKVIHKGSWAQINDLGAIIIVNYVEGKIY